MYKFWGTLFREGPHTVPHNRFILSKIDVSGGRDGGRNVVRNAESLTMSLTISSFVTKRVFVGEVRGDEAQRRQ